MSLLPRKIGSSGQGDNLSVLACLSSFPIVNYGSHEKIIKAPGGTKHAQFGNLEYGILQLHGRVLNYESNMGASRLYLHETHLWNNILLTNLNYK